MHGRVRGSVQVPGSVSGKAQRGAAAFVLCCFSLLSQQPGAYERGAQLARSGKLAEALVELEAATLAQPDNPKVHNLRGVVLTQMGRLAEADKAYLRALELAPGFLPARKNLAVNAFSQKRYSQAASEFEALSKLLPQDPVPALFLGLLALQDSRLDASRTHLLKARRLAPNHPRVLIALVRVELLLGNRESAAECAAAARKSASLSDADRFELGTLLAAFGADEEAREIFLELWRRNPASHDVGFNFALVSYRSRHYDEALKTTEDLLSGGHRTGELLNLRAWILSRLSRPEAARQSLEEALAAEPRNADHYLDLGSLLMNGNDREGALRVLTDAVRFIPLDARLPVAAGLVCQSAGDRGQAERWFRQALQTDPASGPAHLALANWLYEAGRTAEAFDLLARGLERTPNAPLLHYVYGALLLDSTGEAHRGELGRAKSLLLRAAELSPYYANTYYLLGRLSLKQEDDSAAEAYFTKACKLDPRHVGALYQLGQIAQRKGDRKKAAELSRIVKNLRAGAVDEEHQRFTALLQESLRENRSPSRWPPGPPIEK